MLPRELGCDDLLSSDRDFACRTRVVTLIASTSIRWPPTSICLLGTSTAIRPRMILRSTTSRRSRRKGCTSPHFRNSPASPISRKHEVVRSRRWRLEASTSSSAKTPPRIALAFHPSLTQIGPTLVDHDDEFVCAVFQIPSAKKTMAVVAVHAQGIHGDEALVARAGARAGLRHEISALRLQCDSLFVLGDFNSHYAAPEISSWYCFHAVSGTMAASAKRAYNKRRGVDHRALHVLVPTNPAMSTFMRGDGEPNPSPLILDFVAVDADSHARGARATIMTVLAAETVYDAVNERPDKRISDHLPVEAAVPF
jgi:endonuclease/exonuclease/phosphatase family metal-dependent hydrolase